MSVSHEVVSYTTRGKFAIITLNKPSKLNALTLSEFYDLANLLREIDERHEIVVTILTGTGRFFSAGADVSRSPPLSNQDTRRHLLQTFVAGNLYLTRAAATHSKILVAALNGPAVGGGAAVAAFADFIYATPEAYLLLPFASLGLVAEVGTSRTLVQRMGISLANEAMLMGRKISAEELLKCGFLSQIINAGDNDGDFLAMVLKELQVLLGDHLSSESMLGIKVLLRQPTRDAIDLHNVAEVFAGWGRLASGVVDIEFQKIRSGQKRHKL
ncbi:hypothetical protein LTR84_001414 [Exophiala bonariae]|uniref:Enoyl-CoA hydratase n=1 Tax=Exophiala bonariae TaxID=1690606 RepID=A0AAV9NF17_9EURO|nr:hypothetical protein LTR84_001414 [Exophiala bonariae]